MPSLPMVYFLVLFWTNSERIVINCWKHAVGVYETALTKKEITHPATTPEIKVTAQGGVGTNEEHNFLLESLPDGWRRLGNTFYVGT